MNSQPSPFSLTASDDQIMSPLTEKVYNARCGRLIGKFHLELFTCPGIHKKCIEFGGKFISPLEFTVRADRVKSKDWKGSIFIKSRNIRVLMRMKKLDFHNHDTYCSRMCSAWFPLKNQTKGSMQNLFYLDSVIKSGNATMNELQKFAANQHTNSNSTQVLVDNAAFYDSTNAILPITMQSGDSAGGIQINLSSANNQIEFNHYILQMSHYAIVNPNQFISTESENKNEMVVLQSNTMAVNNQNTPEAPVDDLIMPVSAYHDVRSSSGSEVGNAVIGDVSQQVFEQPPSVLCHGTHDVTLIDNLAANIINSIVRMKELYRNGNPITAALIINTLSSMALSLELTAEYADLGNVHNRS